MTGKHNKYYECSSCGCILTIERMIGPKVGVELDVCVRCLVLAFEEVLKENGVLPLKSSSSSTT
jgi:hypothetical protein